MPKPNTSPKNQLAYLAGIIDGEGSIMLLGQGPKRSRRPHISVAMADRCVPEYIQSIFGGFLREGVRKPQRQNMLIWNIKGTAAIELLNDIYPYLRMHRRRAVAQLLKQWEPAKPKTQNVWLRNKLFKEMQLANKKRLNRPPKYQDKEPKAEDFAYLAGILDGEGHITPKGRIEISSTDPEMLSWCKSRFGGNIYKQKRKSPWNTFWVWVRSPTGNMWAEQVSSFMLISRKAEILKKAQGFVREASSLTGASSKLYSNEQQLKTFLSEGYVIAEAARKANFPYQAARKRAKLWS
jgi:hypothetical protein